MTTEALPRRLGFFTRLLDHVTASTAMTATPIAFGPEHVGRLRRAGLADLAVADAIHAGAFFNGANRLMLSLGEPAVTPGS
jgi:alkylhydroperoxidase family enzyme